MKILAVSPLELPYTIGCRYSGLERLAVEFAEQWAQLGHEVTLMAHRDTAVPKSVILLPCEGYETIRRPMHAEVKAFQQYQGILRNYDVIWDIGHLHLIARYMTLPVVSVFSANPQYEAMAGSQKASYNLISWSKWGIGEIRRWYKQNSVYQETIMIDPEVYKSQGIRNDRFLTIGRMAEPKGNLNAVILCKKLGLKLDVAGGRGSEIIKGQEQTPYEKAVKNFCDGNNICFLGEIDEEEKIGLMQSCRALLYITNHVEITSHKVQEALLCGAPVLIPNSGGMPEIVTHGVDGFLCNNEAEYILGIEKLDTLDTSETRDSLINKYHPRIVAENYIKLFESVIKGARW